MRAIWRPTSASNVRMKIYGACYPEKHPQAATLEEDIDNLKRRSMPA